MKKLITEKIIEEFAKGGGKVFLADNNTLITPSAKDLARNKGIAFVNKEEAEENAAEECECCTSAKEEKVGSEEPREACEMSYDRQLIVEAVMKALAEKGILDKILDK